MLFNEPKLLKYFKRVGAKLRLSVSVLFNEPKLLKSAVWYMRRREAGSVSVLFNEPKLLKSKSDKRLRVYNKCFSALQRAEIAEIAVRGACGGARTAFQCSSTSRNC